MINAEIRFDRQTPDKAANKNTVTNIGRKIMLMDEKIIIHRKRLTKKADGTIKKAPNLKGKITAPNFPCFHDNISLFIHVALINLAALLTFCLDWANKLSGTFSNTFADET